MRYWQEMVFGKARRSPEIQYLSTRIGYPGGYLNLQAQVALKGKRVAEPTGCGYSCKLRYRNERDGTGR